MRVAIELLAHFRRSLILHCEGRRIHKTPILNLKLLEFRLIRTKRKICCPMNILDSQYRMRSI